MKLKLLFAAVVACMSICATAAEAHPLGNFSINHLTQVRISSDRVDLHYILDQAEIPTFQERGLPSDRVLASKQAEVARGLIVLVDGRRTAVRTLATGLITHPAGQGGLPLTRVEISLQVASPHAHSVSVRDLTYPDRVGWKAVVAQPGSGTSVRSSAPSGDPTNALRSYPQDMLKSPLDQRTASFSVAAGDGSLVAPKGLGEQPTTTNRSGDGLAGVFSKAADGKGVLIFLLLAAFGWGALHALSPGHGKAMVAAYLVGSRGTPRHAVALGATVTVTHTMGVFALGAVTLLLSQYVLPEQILPWLTLASGLLVLLIGAGVLRSRLRLFRLRRPATAESPNRGIAETTAPASAAGKVGEDHASHGHDHSHEGHSHSHGGHDHSHGGHDHSHGHSHGRGHHHHHLPDRITWRGLIVMGASAGLIPCPSALVVLLGAIAQHQVLLGLLLITAFSVGLAATLTGLGLTVVFARGITTRVNLASPLASALPAASALVIVGAGLLLTAQALPKVI